MATEKYKALMSEYRTLAKRADQRLVRLEKRANSGQEWKAVTKYAYANAMEEIKRFSGANAKRFNVNPPNNTQMLEAKINAMKRFLESPTSTTSGIRSTYEKRVNTINKEYGTDFTWQELKEFFDSTLSQKLDAKIDSKMKLIIIGIIYKNKDLIKQAFADHKPVHIKLDDDVAEYEVNKVLQYYKKDTDKLLGG